MRAIRASLLLALLAAPGWSGAASAQLLPFIHYTADSEPRALPSAEVHSVYQDQLGFLWAVVYSSGLVRYDGVRMEVYALDDGLRSLTVWDVAEDPQGRLWVSSNEGLSMSEKPLSDYGPGERIAFLTERDGVDLVDVQVRRNVMVPADDGSFWVGTATVGIVRYRFERGRLVADTLRTTAGQGSDQAVRSMLARRDGSIWAGITGGRLMRFLGDGSVSTVDGAGAPETTVFSLYEDPSGVLWGGNVGGRLWRLHEGSNGYTFETVDESLPSTIHSIRSSADGRLYAGSEGAGMLVLDRNSGELLRSVTRRNGLISDVVHHVRVDEEGNIWIAQTGGMSKLRYNYAAFVTHNARSQIGEQPVLPGASVNAVRPMRGDGPCHVWVGTATGAACVHHEELGGSTYVTATEGLLSDYVNALVLDEEGRVWVGTSRGVNVIVPRGTGLPRGGGSRPLVIGEQPHRLVSFPGAWILAGETFPLPVSDASPDQIASLWFSSGRAAFAYVDDEWFRIGEGAGLPSTVVHAVASDENGHVWIGMRDQGLYRSVEPISVTRLRDHRRADAATPLGTDVWGPLFEQVWSSTTDAPTDQIESLLWHEGVMWAATPVGLFALEHDAGAGGVQVRAHLDQQTGLGASHAYSFAVSPETGSLWVGTNGGISEVDPRTMSALRTVTRRHGLIDNEVWWFGSVRTDARGRVFFGTAQGLTIYDPRLDLPAPEIEKIHLRRAHIVGGSGGHNEASFEYAAATFASEGSVLYRTRLRGYESDWSEPTTEAKIRYTNLPAVFSPRPYTFEVIASNVQGVWTQEPLQYSFHVYPPWWLRWWMFAFYAGLVGVGLAVAHNVQRRRLIKQMRARTKLREAEYRADRAAAEQEAAEARARALQAENERKETELTKARELAQAYNELKNTQNQLIQAEKMASLGQLTAGIAHEIKNPLNFVNNFSRASIELLAELREEIEQLGEGGRPETIDLIVADLATMAEKVAQHGDRADRIVKSMLQHSRGASGNLQEENLNGFVDEYVNLAYHGMRAQHSGFDVEVVRDFADDVGVVQVMSQEFSRVIINLLNNAFYAVYQQKKALGPDYVPRVVVRTSRSAATVSLEVEDNGPGIPEAVRDRIFEPFFTTKPTGEGTGLGLSLSYEIITQMHGGQLKVQTQQGSGTTFTVELPARTAAPRGLPIAPEVEERGDGADALGPDVAASTLDADGE